MNFASTCALYFLIHRIADYSQHSFMRRDGCLTHCYEMNNSMSSMLRSRVESHIVWRLICKSRDYAIWVSCLLWLEKVIGLWALETRKRRYERLLLCIKQGKDSIQIQSSSLWRRTAPNSIDFQWTTATQQRPFRVESMNKTVRITVASPIVDSTGFLDNGRIDDCDISPKRSAVQM